VALLLLQAGAELFRPKPLRGTALTKAAASDDLNLVAALVDRRADVNERTAQGSSPLHAAASSRRPGTTEVARFLLERGTDLNARAASGSTPHLSAAETGHLEAVQLLTAAGADIQIPILEAVYPRIRRCYRRYTPLMIAIAALEIEKQYVGPHPDRTETVRALVAAGSDPEAPTEDGETALSLATRFLRHDLLRVMRNVPLPSGHAAEALIEAVEAGDAEAVRSATGGVAPRGIFDERGETPLSRAAAMGHVAVVAALLEAGASPNDADAATPLGNAAAAGHVAVVRALIAAGANLDERTRGALTPLMVAARAGHLDVVQALVEAGAAVDATDPWSFHTSALYHAAHEGQRLVYEYLAPLTPARQLREAEWAAGNRRARERGEPELPF
jgi:ankyrin repeat protein